MSDPSAPIALSAHLALVSSISFGGFPTVLPDFHNFVVVTHGWMTGSGIRQFFRNSPIHPRAEYDPDDEFYRVEGVGNSRSPRERVCHLWTPLYHLLRLLPAMGSVPQCTMAADRASRPGSGSHGAGHRQRHCDGACGEHRMAGRRPHDCRSRDHARDTTQSDVDAPRGWRSRRPRPTLIALLSVAPVQLAFGAVSRSRRSRCRASVRR